MAELLVGPLRTVRSASSTDTREVNRRSALHAIASGAASTRADIARVTGLTRPTVSSLISELVDDGLVVEMGLGPSAGGKRPTLLAIDMTARQLVAIDASASPAVGQLTDLAGAVHATATARPATPGDDVIDALVELISDLSAQASAPLAGVGIGTPGLVADDGVVVEAANLGWQNRPLRDELQRATGLPVWAANDADAAALVEFGRLREDRDSLALVRLGSGIGIGVGLVLGGRLHHGIRTAAGEVGHLVVVPGGQRCSCGRNGCLETVASVRAVLDAAGADPDEPPADLAALIAAHGTDAEAAIERAALHLGATVANLVALLDILDVVLSVELPGVGEVLAERVGQVAADHLLPMMAAGLEVRATANSAALVLDGAQALVLAGALGMVRP